MIVSCFQILGIDRHVTKILFFEFFRIKITKENDFLKII